MEQVTLPGKDLSNKNEDNKYEPFTFELKPDPHYEQYKVERRSSSSTSSSTDSDDDDDFIQLDTLSLANRPPNNGPSAISHNNPNPDQSLFRPTSQPVFSVTPVNTTNDSDVLVSDDLSRIPTSVFTTQSKVPMEWSVTSAESLFSLNISNSSSRGNAIFNGLQPTTPTTPGSAVSDVSLEGFGRPLEVLEETGETANDDVVKDNAIKSGTDGGKLSDVTVANSQRSDGSISSFQSFAFPVLAKPQPHPSPLTAAVDQSVPAKPESKSEPQHERVPSSTSNQLTQPPQPQVMSAPDKEAPTVAVTTAATSDNVSNHDVTKTSTTTNNGGGSCCSFCS